MVQATRAADFLDTIGINVHFSHGFEQGTQYGDAARGAEALAYLGVDLVRDHVPDSSTERARFDALTKAGIEFDFLINQGTAPQQNVDLMRAFAQAHPGAVASIEEPSEVDLWPVSFGGKSGTEGAKAYQAELFRLVNADSTLRDIPVYNMTIGVGPPTLAGDADYANVHAYRPSGLQPIEGLKWHLDYQRTAMPGKPMVLTETGYYTLPGHNEWEGVDEASQAKLTLNTLSRADAFGVERTFIYQLFDHAADPSGTNREAHFGQFDVNFRAKKAADALHNLTTILADDSTGAKSFAAGVLNYTASGLPAKGGTKLLQQADGAFDIVVWNEPDIWDEANNRAVSAPTTPVTLKLEKAFSSIKVYDPMTGTTAISTAQNTDTVTLNVTDHPLIVEVSNAVPPPQTAPKPVALTIGTGSDSLVLKISQDAYQGDAQYIVKVDGVQIGGTQTAQALHSSGQSDTVTVRGDWAAGAHTASVTFLNDAWGGTAATDRNLYLDGSTYNGATVSGATLSLQSAGARDFSFREAPPAGRTLKGTANADNLVGGAGADRLRRMEGNDTLKGADGNDVISGGAGADLLDGGAGEDWLSGGAGADTLTGGLGADRFVIGTLEHGGDTILDFSSAQGDKLDVRAILGGAGTGYGALSAGGFFRLTAVTGGVRFDVDEDGGANEWVAQATFSGATVAGLGTDILV